MSENQREVPLPAFQVSEQEKKKKTKIGEFSSSEKSSAVVSRPLKGAGIGSGLEKEDLLS